MNRNDVDPAVPRARPTKQVDLFCDGACRGNPGVGGWGVVLRFGAHERHLNGAERMTTNNRMELTAAIRGLAALRERCRVQVTTDSKYVQQGIVEWLPGWRRNGWRTAAKKPVKNAELWRELDALATQHDVSWHWVRGHSGHRENELADTLANQAIDELLRADSGGSP
ncbi:MAG: ribonuclease HI [Gammaproteobacteria bacterium]|nr:ribonuclease HI [Gammaproteobacteria bacterium]